VFTEPPRVYEAPTPADAPLATPPVFTGPLSQPVGAPVNILGNDGLKLNSQFSPPLPGGAGTGTPLAPQ